MSKRCVVFGANGFIGSSLTRALLSEGHSVVGCDVVRDFFALTPADQLECQTVDFLDEVAVRHAVRDAQWVFHLVSTTKPASSNANMAYDVQSNVVSSIHLFQACVDAGVEKVLFASSGGTVYGVPDQLPVGEDHPLRPIVSYGLTKSVIERYAELFRREHGLRTISLRIGNPYGPRHYDQQQGVIPVFIRRLQHAQPVEIWGDGSVVRDYVHVDDVSQAFIAAAHYAGNEVVFNIGAGEGHSLSEILERLSRLSDIPPQVVYRPARGFDIPSLILDTRRAREHLGWTPQINFDNGLEATWQSLK